MLAPRPGLRVLLINIDMGHPHRFLDSSTYFSESADRIVQYACKDVSQDPHHNRKCPPLAPNIKAIDPVAHSTKRASVLSGN